MTTTDWCHISTTDTGPYTQESYRRPKKKRLYPQLVTSLVVFLLIVTGCSDSTIKKGTTSLQLGDYVSAMKFFSAELEKRPNSYAARLGMGKAMLQKSIDENTDTLLWRRALVHLEAARTLAPVAVSDEITHLLAQAWTYHAHSLLAKRDTIAALGALSRSIEYDPLWPEPLNLAGIVYFRIGDPQKSVTLFTRATQLDSLNSSSYFNLGMVYWQENDIARAHNYWMKALRLSPDDEDILYWFALAEKKLRAQP